MEQPVGRITQFRLHPIRPFWSLGSGWAAVSGGLAAGGLALSPETLLFLFLVWFLADPLLGVIWDLGSGGFPPSSQPGLWARLLRPRLPEAAPPLHLVPYTQAGSPGHRLAQRLGQLRRWWQTTLRPEAGREVAALVAAIGLAMLLGIILGGPVLMLVLVSVILSWLAALSDRREVAQDATQQPSRHYKTVTLWHTLGEFGIPWLVGMMTLNGWSWPVVLLGACYTITYFGFIQPERHFRLLGASQATAALLLTALRHPLIASATAILLMPQWGLHIWAEYLDVQSHVHPSRIGSGEGVTKRSNDVRFGQPFVILSMLMAALAIAS